MSKVDWKSNGDLAVGKGATVQEFMAIVGADKLAINVAPWGEGRLRVNGQEIAHLNDAKDGVRLFVNSRRSPSTICRPRPHHSKNRGTP